MAHVTMKKIETIECQDCGSILKGYLIQYTMHNWKFCPHCGSDELKVEYKK